MDVFQPCVTFNKVNTFSWYREHTYSLEDAGHDSSDKFAAYKRASEDDRFAIGVFYKEDRPTYEDEVLQNEKPLHTHDISDVSVKPIMESFA